MVVLHEELVAIHYVLIEEKSKAFVQSLRNPFRDWGYEARWIVRSYTCLNRVENPSKKIMNDSLDSSIFVLALSPSSRASTV